MFGLGSGVGQSDVEAARWVKKAAEQGHIDAQAKLGEMFGLGRGVAQNDVEAARWVKKSAEQGHIDAQAKYWERCLD
jgi:TPR repeat protein